MLQFFEIMFLTDLVQYWVHRAFHRVPWLWNFHAVHHSAEVMDWLASSRMHVVEIVVPARTDGDPDVRAGVLGAGAVRVPDLRVHPVGDRALERAAQLRPAGERGFVTPRFHHWHHGIEREAIDVNFAVHFPLLDRLFGTYHLPADGRWPSGYGIQGKIPRGFWGQFLHPFRRKRVEAPPPATAGGDDEAS